MQRDYRTQEGVRPHQEPALAAAEEINDLPARLFLCRGCRGQVLICSHCDRGQIYCARGCAERARRRSLREAGRRYQTSRRGRIKHAERARRYRARKNTVPHQGSPRGRAQAVLSDTSAVKGREAAPKDRPRWQCHVCHRPCSAFMRRDFLQRCRGPWNQRRGRRHDHSP